MHRGVRVYLSGGMEYAPDEGRNWRTEMERWLMQELGCTVFNPNRESERFLSRVLPGGEFRTLRQSEPDRFQKLVSEIVDFDLHAVAERTEYLICYWDGAAARGAGTKGEISLARFLRKPVYLVTSIEADEIPGWVLGCSTRVFGSFEELKKFLVEAPRPGV